VSRLTRIWLVLAWAGFLVLPWYMVRGGANFVGALLDPAGPAGPALVHAFGGAWWLLPLLVPLGLSTWTVLRGGDREEVGRALVLAAALGLVLMALQGFAIGHRGWSARWLAALFGEPGPSQRGMGIGAAVTALAFLMLMCQGFAARGWCRGDSFVVSAIGTIAALIGLFVFYPILTILASAFEDNAGNFAPALFVEKFFDGSIWGLDCLTSTLRCGVAWNTLFLAVLVGVGTTALGLAFALIATRTGFRFKGPLRLLTVLPIITPPFVIGLALILLFGRAGAVSTFLWEWFEIPRTRWSTGCGGC